MFIKMKKCIVAVLFLLPFFWACPVTAQDAPVKNKYGMKLIHKDDGSYSVDKKTRRILKGEQPEGLLEPYSSLPAVTKKMVEGVEPVEVVYKKYKNRKLKLYICEAEDADRPVPVLFMVHGGGWFGGSATTTIMRYAKYFSMVGGVTTVNVEYSLAGEEGVTIETVMKELEDAVKYVRKNARKYHLDMSRIGFIGSSAGGQLATMTGFATQGTKVIVGWVGAYDLLDMLEYWPGAQNKKLTEYFHRADPEVLRKYSPVYNVPTDRKLAVATFYGSGDTAVNYEQAEHLCDALRAAGHKVAQEFYPYYSHGLVYGSDKKYEILNKTLVFLKENL